MIIIPTWKTKRRGKMNPIKDTPNNPSSGSQYVCTYSRNGDHAGLRVQGFFYASEGFGKTLNRRISVLQTDALPLCYRALILGILLLKASAVYASPAVDLSTIARIESSGNPKAVGDGGKALGLYQLHAGVIKDYNKAHKTNYSHEDLIVDDHFPEIALDIADSVASWYLNTEIPRLLKHFKLKDTLENRLTAYNMGISAVKKGRIAHAYLKKYLAINGSIQNKKHSIKKRGRYGLSS